MRTLLAATHLAGPKIDWAGLSPLIALLGGAAIVLLVGLVGTRWVRAQVVPALTLCTLAATLGLTLWQWGEDKSIMSGLHGMWSAGALAGSAAGTLAAHLGSDARAHHTLAAAALTWSWVNREEREAQSPALPAHGGDRDAR